MQTASLQRKAVIYRLFLQINLQSGLQIDLQSGLQVDLQIGWCL